MNINLKEQLTCYINTELNFTINVYIDKCRVRCSRHYFIYSITTNERYTFSGSIQELNFIFTSSAFMSQSA